MVFGVDGCSFHCAHQRMYENADENIGNLEVDYLSIEVANHSQRIVTLIQNDNCSMLHVINVRKLKKLLI